MKRLLTAALLAAAAAVCPAQYTTLTGTLQASNGLPASNFTIALTLSQYGYVAGTGVQVPTSTYCATSTDGSVVGLGNPLNSTTVTPAFSGTLPAATYYVEYAFYVGATVTLVSPEMQVQLSSTGQIQVAAPTSGIPAGATGMSVYIGTASGTETLQGQTTGSAVYTQSVPLVSGSALPATNTTVCKEIANDTIWPVGTGYIVALSDASGNTMPGYPMMWQILGANSTVNLSNGLPYYHGVVTYPVPILASPYNHATQSIAGGLALSGPLTSSAVNGDYVANTYCGATDLGTCLTTWSNSVTGSGTMNIPNGSYSAANPITINQGQLKTMTLHCSSRATVINYTGNGDLLYITSNTNSAAQVKIENCTIYGGAAGAAANGIHLFDTQNVRLDNVMVYGFRGYNLLAVGSIDLQSFGSDFSGGGLWNVKLAPDPVNRFASNANHFYGGSFQYGVLGNFWDAGDSSDYGGDTSNTLDGVTEEEDHGVPQNLIEGTWNDAITNGYIEYIGYPLSLVSHYATILGNYAGSPWGSSVDRTAVAFRYSNNHLIMPAYNGNVTAYLLMANTSSNIIDDTNFFDGGAQYGISFYASGTNGFDYIGHISAGFATSLYQNPPASHNRLWWPVDANPGLGQNNVDNNGNVHFGGLAVTNNLFFGGGIGLGTSSGIPQYCGTVAFPASVTSNTLPCGWVTGTSHCLASWVGTTPAGGAIAFNTSVGNVQLTAVNSNSNSAAVYCSAN